MAHAPGTPHSRRHLVLSRWASLFACGLAASAVVILLQPILASLADRASAFARVLGIGLTAVCVGGVLGMSFWHRSRGRLRGVLGIRYWLSYPPWWVAVAIGTIGWTTGMMGVTDRDSVLTPHREGLAALVDFSPYVYLVPALIALVAIAFSLYPTLIARRIAHNAQHLPSPQSPESIWNNAQRLVQWLRTDDEISSVADDLFTHTAVARRIASRLREADRMPAIALVGPLGSGKTTIRRLVENDLLDRPDIEVIPVSLWPFDAPQAAVRGMLDALKTALGRHVNTLPLMGMPSAYVAAIESADSRLAGLGHFLRGPSSPRDIIQQLHEICCATGLRLVLWVEDAERFSGGDQLGGRDRTRRSVERLGSIHALFHLLEGCPEMCVIISDTSLRTRFDIAKIARFVEHPPGMKESEVSRALRTLRANCLATDSGSLIYPGSTVANAVATPEERRHPLSDWLDSFRERPSSIAGAIATVLRTPRSLKWALRLSMDSWDVLSGEIEFDGVVVASSLRVAEPQLFALIDESIELFRSGFANPLELGDAKGKPHPVLTQVQRLVEKGGARRAAALTMLLNFLFPKYPPGRHSEDREYVERPQGLFVNRHADNWRRYTATAAVSATDSDQAALRSIRDWENEQQSDLVERLIDPHRSEQIETFVGQFSRPIELLRLLIAVAVRLEHASARSWEDGTHAPGIVSLWRMMLIKRPSDSEVVETLEQLISRLASVNLPLVSDIVYFVGSRDGSVQHLLSESHSKAVQALLVDTMMESALSAGGVVRLRDSMRNGSPWIVWRLLWGLDRVRKDAFDGLPHLRWKPFSSVLLDLAELEPSIGVPMLVPFVTGGQWSHDFITGASGEGGVTREWKGHFRLDDAKRLFDVPRLLRALADYEVPDDLDFQTKAQCQTAVSAARSILASSADSSNDSPSRASRPRQQTDEAPEVLAD